MAFSEDLSVFVADFGVPVHFAGSPADLRGIVEEFDDVLLDEAGQAAGVVGRQRGVLVVSSAVAALAHGAAITVDGVTHTVRKVLAVGDGAFSAVLLKG